jgi:hypothetical protein
VAKPVRAAEPSKEPSKKAAARRKPARPAASCRSRELTAASLGPRCKNPVGHQLSLTGEISPVSLRAQYSF